MSFDSGSQGLFQPCDRFLHDVRAMLPRRRKIAVEHEWMLKLLNEITLSPQFGDACAAQARRVKGST
jgi:hypothetical protein